MTRKQYINKMQNLMLAIYKDPQSRFPNDYKIGKAIREFKRNTKNVPGNFGSYKAAWDCEPMRFARKHYLKETIA